MALRDQLFIGGAWVNDDVRITAGTGTPVTSATDAGTGEAIADDYLLTISNVSGGTCTVTVDTSSPNNPYKGRVANGVAKDGATQYRNIIPGVILVISGTAANGNTATINVGQYLGTFDAYGAGAGVPSTAVRHRVVNDGSGAVSGAKATLQTQAALVKMIGTVFNYVKHFAPGATEKIAGSGSTRVMPYVLTIANTSGAGASKVADLLIDGVNFSAGQIQRIADGTTSNGTALKAISPAEAYKVVGGPLTGLEFALDATCANGDEANVLIFPTRYVQIAPEVAGAPGTWGTADVTLTQAGQSAGVIQPAGEAFYYTRINVPAGSGAESNPYLANVALTATETGAAGWTT